jgi:hypothetical protein
VKTQMRCDTASSPITVTQGTQSAPRVRPSSVQRLTGV